MSDTATRMKDELLKLDFQDRAELAVKRRMDLSPLLAQKQRYTLNQASDSVRRLVVT